MFLQCTFSLVRSLLPGQVIVTHHPFVGVRSLLWRRGTIEEH
ncbi:hypothetical protein [Phormidesmis priestleyi]|nr:hypothetical protein [Phormidesmis priestleyi]